MIDVRIKCFRWKKFAIIASFFQIFFFAQVPIDSNSCKIQDDNFVFELSIVSTVVFEIRFLISHFTARSTVR